MKLLTHGATSDVFDLGDSIAKRFSCPISFIKELYVYQHFQGITPKLLHVDYANYELIIEKLHTWREKELTPDAKQKIFKSVIQKLYYLWTNQYIHGDFHMDNVVFNDEYEAFLIDFEWLRHRLHNKFIDDVDMTPHGLVNGFDGCDRSIKNVLGVTKEQVMELLK